MKKSIVFADLSKKIIDLIKSLDKKISDSLIPAKPILIPIKQKKTKR